jgi:elongation of very long chain fatty acids protein 6
MKENPILPVAAVLLYALGITVGTRYFHDRKPWNWRGTMALWNLSLSLFSFVGLLRTAPQLVHNFNHYSLIENFCFDPEANFGSGSTGLWVQLFVLSKFPELLDTFFIVIHKKELILLHWYHHISVLLYCWHSYVTSSPTGLIFCSMNYAVHSLMYFYYFLMAVGWKPKAFRAVYITVAQISQMVVGVAVTIIGCHILWGREKSATDSCRLTSDNNIGALIMYGSYLVLFLQFFLRRYWFSHHPSQSKVKHQIGGRNGARSNGHTSRNKKVKVSKEE